MILQTKKQTSLGQSRERFKYSCFKIHILPLLEKARYNKIRTSFCPVQKKKKKAFSFNLMCDLNFFLYTENLPCLRFFERLTMPLLLRELNMQSHMQTCKLYLTLSTIFATSADI